MSRHVILRLRIAISPRRRSALTLEVSFCFCLLVVAGKSSDVEKRPISSLPEACDAPADSWVVLATAIITWRQHYEEWQALLDMICKAEKEALLETTCKAKKEPGMSNWQEQRGQGSIATAEAEINLC